MGSLRSEVVAGVLVLAYAWAVESQGGVLGVSAIRPVVAASHPVFDEG